MSHVIPSSELIVNDDGSIFHLHIKPEELADRIILMGDPERVSMVGQHFERIETDKQSREFHTITGYFHGERITALSHGIGPDNIDIVLTELDALANIDFKTKTRKAQLRTLRMIRIGTTGSLHKEIPVGSYALSEYSIGFDGVLYYYRDNEKVRLTSFEEAFLAQCPWPERVAKPYVVAANPDLIHLLEGEKVFKGITATAVGFYGPQGRVVRLPIVIPEINEALARFEYQGHRINNYEMESSVIAGLAAMMGHHAATLCLVIANRADGTALPNYKEAMNGMINYLLNRITQEPNK